MILLLVGGILFALCALIIWLLPWPYYLSLSLGACTSIQAPKVYIHDFSMSLPLHLNGVCAM